MLPKRRRWSRLVVGIVFALLGITLCVNIVSGLTTHGLEGILSNRPVLGYLVGSLAGMVLAGMWYSMLGGDNVRSVLPVFLGTVSFLGALGGLMNACAALVGYGRTDFAYHVLPPFVMVVVAYVLTYSRNGLSAISEFDHTVGGEAPGTELPSEKEAIRQLEVRLKTTHGWNAETEQFAITVIRTMLKTGKSEKEVSDRLQEIGINRRGVKDLMKSSK